MKKTLKICIILIYLQLIIDISWQTDTMSDEDESKKRPQPISPRFLRGSLPQAEREDISQKTEAELKELMDQEQNAELGQALIDVIGAFDFEKFKEFVSNTDVPVNYVEPHYKGTALHHAAHYGSIRMVDKLMERENEIDFLARDWKGRLASEHAEVYGKRPEMAEMLRSKEIAQAERMKAQLKPRQTIFADGTIDPPPQKPETDKTLEI